MRQGVSSWSLLLVVIFVGEVEMDRVVQRPGSTALLGSRWNEFCGNGQSALGGSGRLREVGGMEVE